MRSQRSRTAAPRSLNVLAAVIFLTIYVPYRWVDIQREFLKLDTGRGQQVPDRVLVRWAWNVQPESVRADFRNYSTRMPAPPPGLSGSPPTPDTTPPAARPPPRSRPTAASTSY